MSSFVTRRRFLGCASAGALTAFASPVRLCAGEAEPIVLEARPGMADLLEPGEPSTAIWGYQGTSPGPLLRVRQGEEVAVRLVNGLEVPTTIHWHGIRNVNAMDGVAHLTQDPVPPGGSFDYRFTVPDAGTFWYHPHVHGSGPQVARGLYGLLVVDETEPPDIDRDVVVLFDDWRIDANGQIDTESFGSLHDAAHAGRLGNVLTVNSKAFETIEAVAGERLRLRFASTCNARILAIGLGDLDGWVVAIDGQPVAPYRLDGATIELGPGQRVDLIADLDVAPGARLAISELSGEPLAAAEIVCAALEARALRPEPPAPLAANPVRVPAGRPERIVDLVMAGGAMGGLPEATYQGRVYDGRSLAIDHGMVWAMNGIAGMPEISLLSAKVGESIGIRLVNDTLWPHAMHVHGHHFVELGTGAGQVLRDTTVVQPGKEAVVAFVADNPGRWMLHCHMLEHQASGMETWFEVLT